jgi:hypothetical protein
MNPDLAFGVVPPDVPRGAAGLEGVKALAVGQAAIGGAVILLSVTALTAVAGHRRGGGKRGATHAKTSRRPADAARPANAGDPFIGAPWADGLELPPDPEPAEPADDYPSWPGRPGPYALHPDHPSWPGQRDPRWNAEVAAMREDEFSSWTGQPAAPWSAVRPPAPVNGHPGGPGRRRPAWREAPYPPPPQDNPPRPPAGGWPDRSAASPRSYRPAVDARPHGPTAAAGPDRRAMRPEPGQPGRRRANGGPRAGFAPYPDSAPYAGPVSYADPAPYSGGAPYAGFAPGAGPGAGFAPAPVYSDGAAGIIERVRPEASQVRPEVRHVQPGNGQVWDAGSVQLATWIISDANQQATEIRHEARDHAAASLAGAKQEAAELMRQAAERAATTLATAEREAAEARAEVVKLSAHLGGVANYVAENLGTRALRPARSVDQLMIGAPLAEPAAGRAANATAPAAKPASHKAASAKAAAAKAAANPNAVPRQILAGRVMGIIVLAMFMFALLAGTSEVALHGFRFFVFRSVGTGETSGNGLQEDQGPGQPDAPGTQQQLHTP